MFTDAQRCYLAVQSGDARFDGVFYTAVTSTRIYCRPSCTARTPRFENCRFFPSAASAQHAGFRACKRCRPDTVPGSPEWQSRSDTAARAVRLIADGVIDREGVSGLARTLGYSERQLNRVMHEALGAGPLALARSQRAQNARILIETTSMSFTEVTYAAGFSSIRQFNDTIREIYATTPTELRTRSKVTPCQPGTLSLRLAYRPPIALDEIFSFLATRALAGIEHVDGDVVTRSLRLPNGSGVISVRPDPSDRGHRAAALNVAMQLDDVRDLAPAVARIRRWLDLDADPTAIDAVLSHDPVLRPLVTRVPGRRVPGSVDGTEMAVRAIVGQQVSVAGARTIVGRIVERLSEPIAFAHEHVHRVFPSAHAIADAELTGLGMPTARADTVRRVCAAIARGDIVLDAGADWPTTRAQLLALRGVGPWTADYLMLRSLADPDGFLPSDLGVKHAAVALGIANIEAHSQRWRPWRAYALMHLWSSLA